MSFVPTIVFAGTQNVIIGELPPDAKLTFTVTRRDCKMLQYRSALVRKALRGRCGCSRRALHLQNARTLQRPRRNGHPFQQQHARRPVDPVLRLDAGHVLIGV